MPGGCQVQVSAYSLGWLRLYCATCKDFVEGWHSAYVSVEQVCEAVLAHLGSGFPFACGHPGCTCGACEPPAPAMPTGRDPRWEK